MENIHQGPEDQLNVFDVGNDFEIKVPEVSGEQEQSHPRDDEVTGIIEFAAYLESGEAEREQKARKANLFGAFDEFSEDVAALQTELKQYSSPRDHPNHLGDGATAYAYSLLKDNQNYVIRIPSREDFHAGLDSRLNGAVRGMGLPHLEQVVAASYEQGVTVSKRMAGQALGEIAPDELTYITEDQIEGLVDTVIAAGRNGIYIDPKVTNYFYDRTKGFGIIDYQPEDKPSTQAQSTAEMVATLSYIFSGINSFSQQPQTIEGYDRLRRTREIQVSLMTPLKQACQSRFSGDELIGISNAIDRDLGSLQEELHELSDPHWVNSQIEATHQKRETWARSAIARATSGNERSTAESDIL